MTEEQKKRKAERDRRYREKKKAEKSKEQAMFASSVPGEYITYTETSPGHFVANVLTSEEVQPAPETAPESSSVMELLEGQESFREEFKGVPAKSERELTPFELLKRRRERYS